MSKTPIVFVHGMFVTPLCWAPWVQHFNRAGFECIAPAWPGRDNTVDALRAKHPDAALGQLTLTQVVAHYEQIIRALPTPPVLIGHSMGGLIVQKLLQSGLGSKGVAINSAPPRGVFSMRWSFLRSNWPVINPFIKATTPYMMSFKHFCYTFAHTLPVAAQQAAYETHIVPESRTVGRAALGAEAQIDFSKPRAPLLMVAGALDRIIPASLNRSNHRKYRNNNSVTDFKEFEGRTHYIIGQPGWEEVASSIESWVAQSRTEQTSSKTPITHPLIT